MRRERNRRIAFASSVGLVQRTTQLVITLITLPLVLHVLGVIGFGVWGAATSLVWLSGILDLGLGSALITLIPQTLAAKRSNITQSYVAAALACGLALSLIIITIGGTLVMIGMQPQ